MKIYLSPTNGKRSGLSMVRGTCMFQYCMIVLILVVVECAGVVVTYLFYEKVEGKLNDLLSGSLNRNYDATFTHEGDGKYTYSSNGDPITLAWDIVQLQVHTTISTNKVPHLKHLQLFSLWKTTLLLY